MSFWLWEFGNFIHKLAIDEDYSVVKLTTLEICSITPYTVFRKNFAFSVLSLPLCVLRDITNKAVDTSHIGPVVKAEGVI